MKTLYIAAIVLVALVTTVLWFSWDNIFYEPQICLLDDLEPGNPELAFACTNEDDIILPPESIDQEGLVQYAFELINTDRTKYGEIELTLTDNNVAQKHADELLFTCMTSYWSHNGLKPYMRYSVAGGEGGVMENVRVLGTPNLKKHWTEESIKQIIAWNQYSMVEDDKESDWQHAKNILYPLHNNVEIGIAWNNFCVAIVQQFEHDYIDWKQYPRIGSNNVLELSGEIQFNSTLQNIDIFFDPTPVPLSDQQIISTPPRSNYGHQCTIFSCISALAVGNVIPMESDEVAEEDLENILNLNSEGTLVFVAKEWSVTHSSDTTTFSISDDITKLIDEHGSGVYTVLLWTTPTGSANTITITTISIFV